MSFKEITGHILDCLLLVNLSTRQMSKYRSRHDVKSWGRDDFFFAEKGGGVFYCVNLISLNPPLDPCIEVSIQKLLNLLTAML